MTNHLFASACIVTLKLWAYFAVITPLALLLAMALVWLYCLLCGAVLAGLCVIMILQAGLDEG